MNVLVIAPHMDDEVLGAGGTIVKHVAQGDRVCVCIAANRAYGHRYSRAAIEKERQAARRAQKILGYHEARFLDLPDEQLDRAVIEVIVPLERVYDATRPDIVYTCHRGDVHQDHRAVFEASMVVCRPMQRHRPRRLLSYEVPSSSDQAPPFADRRFLPNCYEVLTSTQLATKIDALRCYERESRDFPHPRSAEGIATYAKTRGMEAGSKAAEAFMIIRELRG